MGTALRVAEAGIRVATEGALPLAMPLLHPLVDRVGGWSTLDEWACRGLDRVEEAAPIITKPTDEVGGSGGACGSVGVTYSVIRDACVYGLMLKFPCIIKGKFKYNTCDIKMIQGRTRKAPMSDIFPLLRTNHKWNRLPAFSQVLYFSLVQNLFRMNSAHSVIVQSSTC